MSGLRQFIALTGLTALDTLRQPACLLITAICVALTALSPLLLLHEFGEGNRLVRDSGMAFHLLFGLFLASTAAGTALSRELRDGTASSILSKPVDRDVFFVSKFAGVAVGVILFSLAANLATALSERVTEQLRDLGNGYNYYTDWRIGTALLVAPAVACAIAGALHYKARRPFTSTATILVLIAVACVFVAAGFLRIDGGVGPFDPQIEPGTILAGALITLALLVLTAFAITLSSRLGPLPTTVACCLLLLVGMFSSQWFSPDSPSLLAQTLYGLIPDWQHFWAVDFLNHQAGIPPGYVATVAIQSLCHAAGILCLGALWFRHAEVG